VTDRGRSGFGGTAAALSIVLACAVAWSVLPTLLLSAPHNDNVEQLNWSQSLEWGYFKHPPLSTWMVRAAIGVFGPSAGLTYALAMLCVAVALLLVWRCARLVMEPRSALIALLVSTANYYLMGRGSFLNHNTVMLPFVALSAWAVLRIVQGGGWSMWLLLGLAQALGAMTKYQMALIAIVNGLALLAAGVHRRPHFRSRVALAAAVTAVPLIPHVIWLTRHQFLPIEYASRNLLANLGAVDRLHACVSFVSQQIVRLTPALLALAVVPLMTLAARRTAAAPARSQPEPAPADAAALRALAVLALGPFVGIVLLTLLGGIAPQNHWGSTSTLFIPLFLLSRLPAGTPRPLLAVAAATALCHLSAIAWNVAVWRLDPGPHHRFQAQAMATLGQQLWLQHQQGPIRLVIGPDWEAGSISLYLPGHPAVLPNANFREAPWLDPGMVSRCGALVIGRIDQPLEQQIPAWQAASAIDRTVLAAHDRLGRESRVQAALIPPSAGPGCPLALNRTRNGQ
jgi:4-amino-4-deoxy-L-arabinose transferase-like glycosyltransferase